MTPGLGELIRIYREDLPSLQYDVGNASTLHTLWPVTKRIFNVVITVLHYIISEELKKEGIDVASPATSPSPVVLSPPPVLSMPGLSPAAIPGMPNMPQSDVTEVYIAANGTRVVPPAGAGPAVTLPPGAAVDLAAMTGKPELPPAPPGVAQVVLPPGGALSAEVADALANRSGTPT
jgi:hypothetical protein